MMSVSSHNYQCQAFAIIFHFTDLNSKRQCILLIVIMIFIVILCLLITHAYFMLNF